MDFSSITQVISTVGFPIAASLGCAWMIWQQAKVNREDNKSREEKLYSQLDKFSTSLDNFNSTLIRIDTRLEAVEKRLEK